LYAYKTGILLNCYTLFDFFHKNTSPLIPTIAGVSAETTSKTKGCQRLGYCRKKSRVNIYL